MVLPLYDERARKRVSQPIVTWALVALNIAVFAVELTIPGDRLESILQPFGFTPDSAR
jgi:membrane associated rhomboid family serine protease